MQRVFGTFLQLECICSTWNWNALTTKFTLFWSRCTLLCIEYQAGLSSSIEITDKLHRRGARQVACAGFAIVSKQNTEYCRWPSVTMEVLQLLSWCPLFMLYLCLVGKPCCELWTYPTLLIGWLALWDFCMLVPNSVRDSCPLFNFILCTVCPR